MVKFINNQTGSSMLEMLGVLTIIGMVGMGTIKFIGSVQNVFVQNMVVSEARDLQKAISDRYKFEGNYDNLFNNRSCSDTPDTVAQFLCGACEGCNSKDRLAPFQMCSNGKLHHRGGGSVRVCAYDDEHKHYVMFFEGLTDRSCTALAQVNWYTRQKSDIYRMVINSGIAGKELAVESPFTKTEGSVVFPITASQAMAACSNGDTNNDIQLVFF